MDSLVDAFKHCPSPSRNYLHFQSFKAHRDRERERECARASEKTFRQIFSRYVQTRASFKNIAKATIAIVHGLSDKIVPSDQKMSSGS